MTFETTHARATDHETSKQAAREYAPRAGTDMAHLLNIIKIKPGRTCGELFQVRYESIFRPISAAWCYSFARNITRRVSDLHKAGLVRYGEPRRCCVTGKTARPVYANA